MNKLLLVAALTAALTGCANTGASYRPMVDMGGPFGRSEAAYESDLADCQRYAAQVDNAASRAVVGAVIGGIFGALVGRSIGHNFTGSLAAWGAAGGAAGGAVEGETDQRSVVIRCMQGRSWSVLK